MNFNKTLKKWTTGCTFSADSLSESTQFKMTATADINQHKYDSDKFAYNEIKFDGGNGSLTI